MLDRSYLLLGLDGLSHAHGKQHFRDGHLATSIIAACYLSRENALDSAVQARVREHIDRELRPEPVFRPAPEEAADSARLQELLRTLAGSVGDLREVGHNIIFGMAALKVFRQYPETVTPYRVHGICRLIDSFDTTQNVPLAADGIPDVSDEPALIRFICAEFLSALASYSGYGNGWPGHLLTVGHAVCELSRLGYPDLAATAHRAYRMYIHTLRRGPRPTDRRIPDHPPATLTPLDHAYWAQRRNVLSSLGHVFKYPWSFYSLLSRLDDTDLKQRCLAAAHLIF
ncbi:MAG: hypothetical protein R3F42_00110 [Pseudomonadota bacterium]